jgi:hypothetical protein
MIEKDNEAITGGQNNHAEFALPVAEEPPVNVRVEGANQPPTPSNCAVVCGKVPGVLASTAKFSASAAVSTANTGIGQGLLLALIAGIPALTLSGAIEGDPNPAYAATGATLAFLWLAVMASKPVENTRGAQCISDTWSQRSAATRALVSTGVTTAAVLGATIFVEHMKDPNSPVQALSGSQQIAAAATAGGMAARYLGAGLFSVGKSCVENIKWCMEPAEKPANQEEYQVLPSSPA